jgi:hypothetical protein
MVRTLETCTACDIERKPVADETVTSWYEIVFYRCPSCKTTLRVVERKPNIGNAHRLNGNRKSLRRPHRVKSTIPQGRSQAL